MNVGNNVAILRLLKNFGRQKKNIYRKLDETFGSSNWGVKWYYEGDIIDYIDTCKLYEESYYQFLKNNNNVLDWIVSTAQEVYDNSLSNINSGLDYNIQETDSTHLQDIAVRNAIQRLGETFKGDHLVQIRGYDSQGYCLNPGQVPFHNVDAILEKDYKAWWNDKSTEDFYQANKVLVVNPENLKVTRTVESSVGIFYRLSKSEYLLPDEKDAFLLWKFPGRKIRRLTHEEPDDYKEIKGEVSQPYLNFI